MKKKLFTFISCIIFISLFSTSIFASDLTTWTCDSNTGWCFSRTTNKHHGSKSYTYKFASDTIKTNYSSIVTSGKGLWGTEITLTLNSTSTQGTFDSDDDESTTATATTQGYIYDGDHISSWTIMIHSKNFDNNTTNEKNRTIAHEIGHAYGLGHVDDTSQIMYGTKSGTKNVTSKDINGINVMTHTHTHGTSTTYEYERISTTKHYKRCKRV